MSPTESQLRAALREGEGDPPDSDALISRALRIRRDRRKRYQAIAGGAAAAAVVGVGTTVLIALGASDNTNTSTSAAAKRSAAAAGAAGSSRTAGAAAAAPNDVLPKPSGLSAPQARGSDLATRAATAQACPATPERLTRPGLGGSAQSRSGGPLFAGDVAAMKLCAYPLQAGAAKGSSVIGDQAASALAKALEAAPSTTSSSGCSIGSARVDGTIEMLAVNARGIALKPVVITVGCAVSPATNGTAVRYVSELPSRLVAMLATSSPKSISNSSSHAPGIMHGSPLH